MPPTTPKALGRVLRRFKRDRKGSTAVEFALVLVPFLLLTVGTLEIALIHLSRSALTVAVEDTSRQIKTGEGACLTATDFIADFCTNLAFSTGNCSNNTKVVVQELADFNSTPTSINDDFDDIVSDVDNGTSDSIMALQVFHRWEVIVPLLDNALGGDDGELILVSNLAFRNEPFGSSNGCVSPPSP